MAGRRQHFLPQFLLKGFAAEVRGDSVYTYCCRKGGRFFRPNIENIGLATDFYGVEETGLDDRITELESDFALALARLRECGKSCEIEDDRIPEFVTHLSIRTRHVRMAMFGAADFLKQRLLEYFENPQNLEELVRRHLRRNPDYLKDLFFEAFRKKGIGKQETKHWWRAMRPQVESLAEERLGEIGIMTLLIEPLKAELTEGFRRAATDGHLKGLMKSVIPEPRLEAMRSLNWSLFKVERDLILGDMGALFCIGLNKFRSLPEKGDEIETVYLPISSGHLIFGSPTRDRRPLAADSINRASAQHSLDFIIGRSESIVAECAPEIGKTGSILTEDELKDMFNEILEEI